MVQLHAASAGLRLTRTTRDVDMILHIDSGAATFAGVQQELERLGYLLREPVGDGPVHRFARGSRGCRDDRCHGRRPPIAETTSQGVTPDSVRSGGTSALRKTVNCEVTAGEVAVVFSIPDVLGALVLKSAAYVEDSRDRDRHLDDAAVLACAVTDPIGDRARMIGSDRRRIEALWKVLQDLDHKSWIATGTDASRGHAALQVLMSD
ncbi:MAG: hypothetical protein O2892_18725 [Actinomycetota bacterium]|nr:hypothetical protein [Actinomycetota bacterium]